MADVGVGTALALVQAPGPTDRLQKQEPSIADDNNDYDYDDDLVDETTLESKRHAVWTPGYLRQPTTRQVSLVYLTGGLL